MQALRITDQLCNPNYLQPSTKPALSSPQCLCGAAGPSDLSNVEHWTQPLSTDIGGIMCLVRSAFHTVQYAHNQKQLSLLLFRCISHFPSLASLPPHYCPLTNAVILSSMPLSSSPLRSSACSRPNSYRAITLGSNPMASRIKMGVYGL